MSKINTALTTFRGPNYFVPNMKYAADVNDQGACRLEFGAPVAANPVGILNAQSIAVAGVAATFAITYSESAMSRYGRNITAVASGVSTSVLTVSGFDYLGQRVTENITLNGATTVSSLKTFFAITSIAWTATAATTVNIGWGNSLGIPYRASVPLIVAERVDNVAPTAGTVVAGALRNVPQTLITADPRGTYTPNAAVLPNGVRVYDLTIQVDVDALHGSAHFAA